MCVHVSMCVCVCPCASMHKCHVGILTIVILCSEKVQWTNIYNSQAN